MVVKIMGKRYAKGVNKSGRPYEGFHTSIGYSQTGYDGLKCEEKFFPCEVLQGYVPTPGDMLDLNVNFGGYIESVSFVDKK